MQRGPLIAVLSATMLFLALYFGFSNVAPERKSIDLSRKTTGTVTDGDRLVHEATDLLNPAQKEQLRQIAPNHDDSLSTEVLKTLSGWWVKQGSATAAGVYAEQIAKREQSAEAWSVAGATLHMGLKQESASEIARTYCGDQAKKAFENAISLEPQNPEHRINLALIYADAPNPDNPMQAVMMLRELEAQYPENVQVYNALGRLAIKTGQWERALQRLEKAYSLAPDNQNTICLLAVAYEGAGNTAKATEFEGKCKEK